MEEKFNFTDNTGLLLTKRFQVVTLLHVVGFAQLNRGSCVVKYIYGKIEGLRYGSW